MVIVLLDVTGLLPHWYAILCHGPLVALHLLTVVGGCRPSHWDPLRHGGMVMDMQVGLGVMRAAVLEVDLGEEGSEVSTHTDIMRGGFVGAATGPPCSIFGW